MYANAVSNREKVLLALLLSALASVLALRAWRVGVTVDEPSHILSASLYWRGEDNLRPRDMPPLIKIAGGWVPALLGLPLPPAEHPVWKTRHEWHISQEMMTLMNGPHARRIFFLSRLPFIAFPLLIAWLLWRWGRELFGPAVAMALAAAYALEPTALGHGALFKNDLAATFGYLLFWYRAWNYWRRPDTRNAAWLGAALSLALLAKMSMLILAPLAVAVVAARSFSGTRPGRRALAASLALVVLFPYVGVLAAYQFDTRRLSAVELDGYARDPGLPAAVAWAGHLFRVIPVAAPMWDGVVSLFRSNATSTVYMLEEIYPRGHPLYFLTGLAVKVPRALQILVASGFVLLAVAAWRRRMPATHLFWILPPLLYIGLASLSSLQLGVRLVLPALPFGLLVAGVALDRLLNGTTLRPARLTVAVALFGWLVFRVAQIYPYPLSFFNGWAGGADRGLHYLADSNLDWGQNLGDLAAFIRSRGIPRIRLSYFGNDNPYRFFREEELELIAPPWSPELARGAQLDPKPGYYAISASLLPGHFFHARYRDYYKVFREMQPIGKAGYSIYVYRVEQ